MTKNRQNHLPRTEVTVERDAQPKSHNTQSHASESQELPIRILTHNIRYATTSPFPGEELWKVRAPHEIAALRFHTLYNPSSFICLQEVLSNQLSDILNGLNCSPVSGSSPIPQPSDSVSRTTNPSSAKDNFKNDSDPEWSYIGVGRDDGHTAGEYAPIFFRPAYWSLHHSRTIWLSPTPSRPSKGWDAASTRIVTIGFFQHRETRKRVLALNTHLDDQGEVSRVESAKMIVKTIREYLGSQEWRDDDSHHQHLNVFLTGDMNSDDHGAAYRVLESAASPVADMLHLVPEDQHHGHYNTGTGFGRSEDMGARIDYVFLGKQGSGWRGKAVMYGVLGNRERGIYVSDHRAVVADVVLGDSSQC